MVLGPKRRLAAALATAAAAIALALTVTGRGCGAADASPEGAARAFVSAARAGDRRGVWDLLGPGTRARLEAAAVRAGEVDATRRYDALSMLEVGAPGRASERVEAVLADRRGDRAAVDVLGPGGARDRLTLVRVGRSWRVELELE